MLFSAFPTPFGNIKPCLFFAANDNIVVVHNYKDIPYAFQDYLRNTSVELSDAVEKWARSVGCDTSTLACRQKIVDDAWIPSGALNQFVQFETVCEILLYFIFLQ